MSRTAEGLLFDPFSCMVRVAVEIWGCNVQFCVQDVVRKGFLINSMGWIGGMVRSKRGAVERPVQCPVVRLSLID